MTHGDHTARDGVVSCDRPTVSRRNDDGGQNDGQGNAPTRDAGFETRNRESRNQQCPGHRVDHECNSVGEERAFSRDQNRDERTESDLPRASERIEVRAGVADNGQPQRERGARNHGGRGDDREHSDATRKTNAHRDNGEHHQRPDDVELFFDGERPEVLQR